MKNKKLADLLRVKPRHITTLERMEANRLMFDQHGFDYDDLERMAAAVDRDVEDLLLMDTRASIRLTPRRVTGKPGRSASTKDIADFAAIRRPQKMTWNQIFAAWTQAYPKDIRVTKADDIREAYRRFYGDKAGKRY